VLEVQTPLSIPPLLHHHRRRRRRRRRHRHHHHHDIIETIAREMESDSIAVRSFLDVNKTVCGPPN
jgi:hypothetical protein